VNVLVTGGAGFIGSNLCERLVKEKYDVVCLDNFITGKRENIKDLLNKENFSLIEGDIRDYETCLKATSGVDMVLHEAALGFGRASLWMILILSIITFCVVMLNEIMIS